MNILLRTIEFKEQIYSLFLGYYKVYLIKEYVLMVNIHECSHNESNIYVILLMLKVEFLMNG